MSIATEITRLQTAKADLKTAIEGKGVTVDSDATIDAYAALVDSIEDGGGGGYGYNIEKVNDGNAHIYLDVVKKYLNMVIYVKMEKGTGGSISVDWGDGTAVETYDSSSTQITIITHTYSAEGFYHVVLSEVEAPSTAGNRYFGGPGNYNLLGGTSSPERFRQSCLVGFEGGNWYIGGGQTFSDSRCEKLFLSGTTIKWYHNHCRTARCLKSIEMPTNETEIGGYGFSDCMLLSEVTVPASVTKINGYAFNSVGSIDIHMESATPPTLDANAFKNNCTPTIYVPSGSLATYQAASNWSTYASSMHEE